MNRIMALLVALLALPAFAATQFTNTTVDPMNDPAPWGDAFIKESIALEATANISVDAIILGTNIGLNVGDKIVFTVTNGATFANSDNVLEESSGGGGTGVRDFAVLQDAPVNGDTSITFVMKESQNTTTALADSGLFILNGGYNAGVTESVDFNLPGVPGTDIYIRADIYTSDDELRESTGNYLMFESSLESASASPLQW